MTKPSITSELCDLIDRGVENRVIVFGSLPPEGTDLDLLVRAPEEAAVRRALRRSGLAEEGSRLLWSGWASALEIELEPAAGWGLPEEELDALFAESTPLPGRRLLASPAPHHGLLILAARTLVAGEPLSPRRRARIDRALAEDPQACERAEERADSWGAADALRRLRGLDRTRAPAAADRARRRLGQIRRLGRGRRGAVVAISGIDGSGKSSQTEALRAALEQIGQDAVVEWIPLASNDWLDRLAAPVKALLARFRSLRRAPAATPATKQGLSPNPRSILSERSPAANYAWALLVAIANTFAHLSRAARHRAAGRTVIFDRYVLDSVARSRFFYGEERPLRLPLGLIRRFSPTPDLAFFLDVPASTSIARKDDIWGAEEIERQVRLYRAEYERSGVTRLDGERPREELAREILVATWRLLRRP